MLYFHILIWLPQWQWRFDEGDSEGYIITMIDLILLIYNILSIWILSWKLAYKHALQLINIAAPI